MALTVSCPSCQKMLRLGDESQGKKLRRPSCQQIFKAPMAPPPEASDPPKEAEEEEQEDDQHERDPRQREADEYVNSFSRPPSRDDYDDSPGRSARDDYDDEDDPRRRSSRDDDDYDDRPSRRSYRDDRDDYDDRDRPRRRRRRYEDDEDYPRHSTDGGNAAKVLGILSCVFCLPICFLGGIGFILGLIAVILAAVELGNVPPGRAYESRRKNLQLGRTLGIVGMCLAVGLQLLACAVNIGLNAGRGGRF